MALWGECRVLLKFVKWDTLKEIETLTAWAIRDIYISLKFSKYGSVLTLDMKTGEKREPKEKDVDGPRHFQINDSETRVPRRICEITQRIMVIPDRLRVKNE